ncbi:hypothetical protein [Nonomuraea polychroma]|nr:hypothetical protein [Nonomuraea polychroma]
MRLTAVALLGIEITIIAQASAASAATHPEGSTVQNGPYEAEPYHGPPQPGHNAMLDELADVLGAHTARTWRHKHLTMTTDLQAMHDLPVSGDRPVRPPEVSGPQESLEQPYAAQERPEAYGTQETTPRRSQADTAAHAGETTKAQEDVARPRPRPAVGKRGGAKSLSSPVRTGVVRTPAGRKRLHLHVDLNRVLPRQAAVRMSHSTAADWLKSAGMRTRSTGNCTSKHMHHCTSLDNVRTGTIARAIELKQQSGCPIMVTGGTEAGHAPGTFSHGNGYKLDIGHNSCIDRYITQHHARAGVRGDGAPLYRSSSGTTFADEGDHWDILFK